MVVAATKEDRVVISLFSEGRYILIEGVHFVKK